jgi:hypothetical protein
MANSKPPPETPPRCPDRLGCAWTHYNGRHFPHRGLTRRHTSHGPARYLPGTTPTQIRAIETETVRNPSSVLAHLPGKSEYVRRMDRVIGWDEGNDATVSYAECSGGISAGRSFHGRPMAMTNHELRGTRVDDQ